MWNEEYPTWRPVCQQIRKALMILTFHEGNEIVANSLKNPLGGLGKLQKIFCPTTGGRKRNFLRADTRSMKREMGIIRVSLPEEKEE